MSVGVNVTPCAAVPAVGAVVGLGKALYAAAQRVKANKQQCCLLAARVDRLIPQLVELEERGAAHNGIVEELRNTLEAAVSPVVSFRFFSEW